MLRPQTLVVTVATVVVWAVVLLTGLIAGFQAGFLSFALVGAIGSTIALWLVWAFMTLDELSKQSTAEKAKRAAPEDDTRLSLLLQLLNADERDSLKRRLRDEMSTDGEAVTLDDLLEERRAR